MIRVLKQLAAWIERLMGPEPYESSGENLPPSPVEPAEPKPGPAPPQQKYVRPPDPKIQSTESNISN